MDFGKRLDEKGAFMDTSAIMKVLVGASPPGALLPPKKSNAWQGR